MLIQHFAVPRSSAGPNKEHIFFTFLHLSAAVRVREKNK